MKMQRYVGEQLRKISFPLGGIGSGSLGLAGNGALIDWELFNRPNKQSWNGFSHFAVRAEKAGCTVAEKVLQGDFLADLSGSPDSFGFGPKRETMGGLPHFRKTEFWAAYPWAEIAFADDAFPGKIKLTAFNPLIPLNDRDSSLPAAFFSWEITNPTKDELTYTLGLTAANPWPKQPVNADLPRSAGRFLQLKNGAAAADEPDYGDLTLATDAASASAQEHWFKGGWFDNLTVFWREFGQPGPLQPRREGDPHATLAAHLTLPPGTTRHVRFVLAWNVPNFTNYWSNYGKDHPLPEGLVNRWKNYYATQFADSVATAEYALQNWDRLEADTRKFSAALYDSTLPDVVLEAAGANVSILKTPTCVRLEDGSFYGFEGCCAKSGCCEGSCGHVWNYAYALPFLFPRLERSMRDLEYRYSLKPDGAMPFRLLLPLGQENSFRACADGQFGNIIKVYREWKLSGDDAWLRDLWPKVKKSIEYAWSPDNTDFWDPDRTGALQGRQHHTLDMELFGPNSWLTGFYLTALAAGAIMADCCGDAEAAAEYRRIYRKGREYLNRELFNGEYFQQRTDLNNRSLLEPYRNGCQCVCCDPNADIYSSYWDSEHNELKYQIGDGCIIDQMLAQWHANLIGLGDVFEPDKAKSALRALYRYNFHSSFRDVANPCRLYAVDDEAGTMICTWPEGKRQPWIPIPYAQEAMHGFAYAAAGQMMQYDMIPEALKMVKAVRDRYNGANRNPWNEMECGSNYARSMASWAFIPILSGFSCDLSRKRLGFAPKISPNAFRCFWSCGDAWGVFRRQQGRTELEVLYGRLELKELALPQLREVKSVTTDNAPVAFGFADGLLTLTAPAVLTPGAILAVR